MPAGVLPAGAYHGVTLFFEVDLRALDRSGTSFESDDAPEIARWEENERRSGRPVYRQLPPITAETLPGGHEVYRLKNLHRVDYRNSLFLVGRHRYGRMPRARLYVFKKRTGPFTFSFRGRPIRVEARTSWIPSVYYYPQEKFEGRKSWVVREVVQVAGTTIESYPKTGIWLVNSQRYRPDPDRPLVLRNKPVAGRAVELSAPR